MSRDDEARFDDLADEDEPAAPGQRLYTVAEANGLIPHLEAAFDAIERGRTRIEALVERLGEVGVRVGQLIAPELAEDPRVRPHLEALAELNEELRALVSQLAELGAEVKGLDGLVDVRSRYHGRIVYLCWRRGEPGFDHWHDLEAGLAGRERIDDVESFEGTLLN